MIKKSLKNIWQFLGLTQETIGRGRYFVVNIATSFGGLIIIFVISTIIYILEYPLNMGLTHLPGFLLEVPFKEMPLEVFIGYLISVLLLALLALWIASIVLTIAVGIKTTIRRVRDIGIAHNWWMLALIPIINFFFFIYLSLEKSGAGQADSFSLTNLTREQFRRFFSHEFSKPFIIICIGVIVAGAINAGSAQLFFEKFGFGWWGIIALVVALFLNILVLSYNLAKAYIPPVFRYGNTQAKSITTNIQGMTPFQRYSLILLAITVLALVVIATVIIF